MVMEIGYNIFENLLLKIMILIDVKIEY